MAAPVSLRLHDAPQHEEFYGFVRPPFTLEADPRFFYPSRSHDDARAGLLRAIHDKEPLAVLTGDDGSGKTTTCRALAERLDDAILTSLVLDPVASVEELLRRLLQDAGVISRDGLQSSRVAAATRAELAGALDEFVRSLPPVAGSCVLILDEAHRLPRAVLEHLDTMTGVQIVLAGAPALLETLDDAALRGLGERIATRVRLEPLSSSDVSAYIAHRLAAAEGSTTPAFDTAAIEAVHRHTGGVPRAINALCDRALVLGAQLGIEVIGREVIEEAARGLGVAPAAAPAGGWWDSVPRWTRIALPILVLLAVLALIAAWSSGAASGLFP